MQIKSLIKILYFIVFLNTLLISGGHSGSTFRSVPSTFSMRKIRIKICGWLFVAIYYNVILGNKSKTFNLLKKIKPLRELYTIYE